MNFFGKLLLKSPYFYSKARRIKHMLFGYPEAELELLRFLVDPDRIAIDVGAHSGLYTAELLRLCQRVIAIEALPELARNIEHIYSSARTINAAASFEEGDATLYIPVDRPGLSTISSENPVAIDNCNKVHVRTVTLDNIADGPVGFIKIDVEGNELNVLRGARAVLQRDKPVLLIEAEERHRQDAVASLHEFLAPLGYSGMMLENGRLRPLEMFDASRDQNVPPEIIDELNAGIYKGHYINNFIFIS
jgi:FkbM family methyltransferase